MTVRAALAGSLLCVSLAALPASPPDTFERGVEAYRSGDYAAALAAFLEAQPSGWSAANLQFNLGLTYYKLHRYEEARAAFERLRNYPGYKNIADYHLGLVAARLGDKDKAQALWQPLAASAPEQAVRDRAGFALDRLSGSAGPQLYASAAAGYDTDPALVDETTLPSGAESASLDLLGTLETALSRSDARDIVLSAGGYWHDYARDNGLDQAGLFGAVARQSDAGDRQRSVAADLGTSLLDGEHFLDSLGASVADAPQRGVGGAAFGAQLTRIEAASPFAYLRGWRARGTAEWRARAAAQPWRASYQLEFNDRADFAAGGEFFSHSPVRHTLGFVLPQAMPDGWTLQWSARWRYSAYRKADVFFVGPTLREQRRIDRLAQAGVQVRRAVGRGTYGFIDYEYSRNASTLDAFDYDRHLLQVGVEWFNAR